MGFYWFVLKLVRKPNYILMRKLFLATLFLVSVSVYAQTKEEKKEARYQTLLELIDSEQYEYVAQRANPPKTRTIDLTTNPNFLRVKEGNGHAEIPYFGRSFSGGYSSGDGGIKFNGAFESYDVTKNDKKRRVTIKFKIKGEGDTYTCTITASGLENSTLTVISNNKQSINYSGYLQEPKAK